MNCWSKPKSIRRASSHGYIQVVFFFSRERNPQYLSGEPTPRSLFLPAERLQVWLLAVNDLNCFAVACDTRQAFRLCELAYDERIGRLQEQSAHRSSFDIAVELTIISTSSEVSGRFILGSANDISLSGRSMLESSTNVWLWWYSTAIISQRAIAIWYAPRRISSLMPDGPFSSGVVLGTTSGWTLSVVCNILLQCAQVDWSAWQQSSWSSSGRSHLHQPIHTCSTKTWWLTDGPPMSSWLPSCDTIFQVTCRSLDFDIRNTKYENKNSKRNTKTRTPNLSSHASDLSAYANVLACFLDCLLTCLLVWLAWLVWLSAWYLLARACVASMMLFYHIITSICPCAGCMIDCLCLCCL